MLHEQTAASKTTYAQNKEEELITEVELVNGCLLESSLANN